MVYVYSQVFDEVSFAEDFIVGESQFSGLLEMKVVVRQFDSH